MADEKDSKVGEIDEEKGTVVVADAQGNEFEAVLGADGKNPISVNNPHPGALQGETPEVPPSQDNASPSAEEQEAQNEANDAAFKAKEEAAAKADTADEAPAAKTTAAKTAKK